MKTNDNDIDSKELAKRNKTDISLEIERKKADNFIDEKNQSVQSDESIKENRQKTREKSDINQRICGITVFA